MFYLYSFEIKLGVHDTVWLLQSAVLNRWRVLGWPVVFLPSQHSDALILHPNGVVN